MLNSAADDVVHAALCPASVLAGQVDAGQPRAASGVITGGTNEFEGITGDIHLTKIDRGIYGVSFQ